MSRRSRRTALVALASAALVAGLAAPTALAYGSGSSQITPGGGCNSGAYYYRSNPSGGQAVAFTSFNGYCWGNKSAGARAIAGASVGSWQYNWGSVTASRSNPQSATVYGNHSINGGYPRNT
ncbi:hypothetical protein GRS96_15420 [Rathayibacter sp. VKM Ac-2803]|uniref:hypothetical protein n=1 Tax=unclassified Rathayibacter TaxID=2609250 RepID=UPI001359BA36|nr:MULTISPECIES: hypothetical protein [unclassified Rathayibacter]MWV50663.1 hypothetical protein [Rathayibacter sp. VKM Ac-2803]MWV59663.1 hypothetical protein [Rathayibacter sp. VKM Ac-2754]